MSQTEKELLAFALAVLISVLISKAERIKGAFLVLLVSIGALAALYGLVKFIRWAWYN